MFREALLESSPAIARRSPWPMATAFTLELILASILVLVPLVSTGILPLSSIHLATPPRYTPLDPARPAPVASATHNTVSLPTYQVVPVANLNPVLADPFSKGPVTDNVSDQPVAPLMGVQGGDSQVKTLIEDHHTPPPEPPKRIVVSHSLEAFLLNRVIPEYPVPARVAGVQGDVKLHAIIAEDGTIQSLTVTSGPDLLREAALRAVQQWRYRPYMLNGKAVEVETVITVSFHRY